MIAKAEQMRLKSEGYMKYNIMVGLLKGEVRGFDSEKQIKINERVGFPIKSDKAKI